VTGSNARTIILLLTALAAGCGRDESKKDAGPATRPAVAVKLAPVVMTSLDRTVDVVGTLFGDEEIAISPKVPGRILTISADVGDRVAGGQQLAQIDPVDYQLEVARRESALSEALSKVGLTAIPTGDFDVTKVSTVERTRFQAANAQAKLERAKKIFQQQPPLISEQEFADIQTAYDVAQRDYEVAKLEAESLLAAARSRRSELASAQQQLADTRIAAPALPAPRTYAVSQRMTSAGEFVATSAPIFRLVLDDTLKFRGSLPERYVGQVQKGQKISLKIEGVKDPAVGEVSRINPAVDTATRTFQIEGRFENSKGALRPGNFGRGTITVGVDDAVVTVPAKAVRSFAGVDKVFTVQDGKAVEHVVNLGAETKGMIALRNEKLGGSKEVVVEGVERLANGAPVTVGASAQTTSVAKE
jgi:RND family efflux transporter MFP subunit